MENIQPGSPQNMTENENKINSNRKASVATINSQGQERCRKMSRDVVPTIDNYRTMHQHQAQNMGLARRPTMHELCNPTSTVAVNEEAMQQDSNEVFRLYKLIRY
jgi:hypothetical protein